MNGNAVEVTRELAFVRVGLAVPTLAKWPCLTVTLLRCCVAQHTQPSTRMRSLSPLFSLLHMNHHLLQAYDNAKSIKNKSQAAVLAAIVHLACRHTGNPRTFKEICAVVPQASVNVSCCSCASLHCFLLLCWLD